MLDETIFTTAAEDIRDQLANASALYTPATGDPIPDVEIFLEFESQIKPDGYESGTWIQETTIEALLSDLGAEPTRGDTFTAGETVYTVDGVVENDGQFVKVVVK